MIAGQSFSVVSLFWKVWKACFLLSPMNNNIDNSELLINCFEAVTLFGGSFGESSREKKPREGLAIE